MHYCPYSSEVGENPVIIQEKKITWKRQDSLILFKQKLAFLSWIQFSAI